MKEQPDHALLLKWLILTGLIAFALIIAWHQDVINMLYYVDKSRISWAISLVYILVTMHCAQRVYTMSQQTFLSKRVDDIIRKEEKLSITVDDEEVRINKGTVLPPCFMTEYIRDIYYRNQNKAGADEAGSPSDLIDVYENRLKGPQEIGWFVSDMMLKMGLLGTIIGFIFMLASVSNIADFDVSSMQKILRHMSNGMGTALYTTLVGLIGSVLSAMQYHMLDRHADELIELTRHLTQVHVIPKID
ncbi:MAG: MotA/TolQ/ExbB proton channel family protein [Gammaproteobacteria bacterium]